MYAHIGVLRRATAPLPRVSSSTDGALLTDGSSEGNDDGSAEGARLGATVDGDTVGDGGLGCVGLTPSQLDELSAKL